jgi:peptidyl-prolyl cis-trans isomerase SurA
VKSRFITLVGAFTTLLTLQVFSPEVARAQEGELLVVDEVIAQVNDSVITLSRLKREIKERIQTLTQNGMTQQQATEEVNKRQAELIATLINEQLLLEKGKELQLANEVENDVNRRMLEIANEQGITSIEKLDEALRANEIDPVQIRQTMRTEIMKQAVIQNEVDRKIFFGLSGDEVKKYFEANREKFRTPESVTLSEIFLSIAGKNQADVKARADELVAQLRAGADFGAVAAANSEREMKGVRTAPQNKGKVGTFDVPSLRDDIAKAIKDIKAGSVSDPLLSPDGYQILRVDERTAGAETPTFNENRVREAMTIERSPIVRETYIHNLRIDGYIKIGESFVVAVEPLL